MFTILAHATSGWLPLEPLPLHPILVNFTAALVPTSVLADVLGKVFRRPSLHATGWWTLLLAALVTPLTAAAGWYWMRQMDMPGMDGATMAVHKWLGISLTLLFVVLAVWRGRMFRRDLQPDAAYLVAATALTALLILQGHLGGSMSFAGDADAHPESPIPTTMPGMAMPPSSLVPSSSTSQPDQVSNDWADVIHIKEKTP